MLNISFKSIQQSMVGCVVQDMNNTISGTRQYYQLYPTNDISCTSCIRPMISVVPVASDQWYQLLSVANTWIQYERLRHVLAQREYLVAVRQTAKGSWAVAVPGGVFYLAEAPLVCRGLAYLWENAKFALLAVLVRWLRHITMYKINLDKVLFPFN